MKNLYNISRGQLITLWIFGVIGWLWALEKATSGYSDSTLAEVLAWIIPLVLIFYTLGWRNNKKKQLGN